MSPETDPSTLEDMLPFDHFDMMEVRNTRVSGDRLQKTKYPKSTEKFRDIILWADSRVEEILIEKMAFVVPTHESIKNISRRRGREYVRSQLTHLRTNPFDSSHSFVKEIHQDMEILSKSDWIYKVLNSSSGIDADIYRCDRTITNLLLSQPIPTELIYKMCLLKNHLQNNKGEIHGLMETLPTIDLETQMETTAKIDKLLPSRIKNKQKKPLTGEDITLGLQTLLEAERPYLWTAHKTPWNQVGPQPYDSTINVFWFRFSMSSLKDSWEGRHKHISYIKSKYYKDATINRIYAYAHSIGAPVRSFNSLESDRPKYFGSYSEIEKHSGLTIDQIRTNAKKKFPLENHLDRRGMESEILRYVYPNKPGKFDNYIRPSYLSKLLWATLKYEAAVPQWKNSKTDRIDRGRDEFYKTTPDPKWMDMGDHHGRLVLPGESLSSPLPHQVLSEASVTIASRKIAQLLDEDNIEYTLDELKEYAIKLMDDNLKTHKQRDVVNHYNNTVKNKNFPDIIKAVYSLKGLQRAIVLSRLGLSTHQECIMPRSKTDRLPQQIKRGVQRGIGKGASIRGIVNRYFQNKPYRYYQSLKKATQSLRSQLEK